MSENSKFGAQNKPDSPKKILVTGGAGYIGSHTCAQLLSCGYQVVVIDNLYNGSLEALKRVEKITAKSITFVEGDTRDRATLDSIFKSHNIETVMHFAGLKAVGESVAKPDMYYDFNVVGSLRLLESMSAHDVKNIVFSSSATVYGDPSSNPIQEHFPLNPANPYGRSKLYVEEILKDLHISDSTWNISILRYFNPVGAHESGEIGEDPNGIPHNLMPLLSQVAVGKLKQLSVFGGDYPTPDGTGIRDYIHVTDLVNGHIKALEKLRGNPGVIVHNLGSGRGYSVLDMLGAMERAIGRPVNHRIIERRVGDIAIYYGDPSKARDELDWMATKSIDDICEDAWRWQTNNPNGYR